ncbi:hypothetical protein D9M72_197540 [compost metagenome]
MSLICAASFSTPFFARNCWPTRKYGVVKSTALARSSVMVKLANTTSALPEVSSGMRLAGLVGTSSIFTPRLFANSVARSMSWPTCFLLAGSM